MSRDSLPRFVSGLLILGCICCGPAKAPPSPPACAELARLPLGLPGVVIAKAEAVPAGSADGGSYPAHCALTAQIDARQGIDGKPYAIGFELRMPLQSYNERFFFQGGGGTDGVLAPAFGNLINTTATNALTLGYAVASTDGGHATGAADTSFGLDPQARIDYGYNAVGRSTEVAKALLRRFYGSAPSQSYFVGCSNGGRQGLLAATRFASEFDGVIAVDPGLNLPQAALAQAWDTQRFMGATSPGQLPKDAFPGAHISVLASSILARCDALDGLADGMVQDPDACRLAFDLERDVPSCDNVVTTGCLNAAQKVPSVTSSPRRPTSPTSATAVLPTSSASTSTPTPARSSRPMPRSPLPPWIS
jgi:hypothetical protein